MDRVILVVIVIALVVSVVREVLNSLAMLWLDKRRELITEMCTAHELVFWTCKDRYCLTTRAGHNRDKARSFVGISAWRFKLLIKQVAHGKKSVYEVARIIERHNNKERRAREVSLKD